MSAQFATHSDLAARLGVTLSTADQARADTLLALSSGLIQREARQTISLVTADTLTVPGVCMPRLRLPERPIVNVGAVTVNGVTVTAGDGSAGTYYHTGEYLVRWCGWGLPSQAVTVTYDHGYNPVPDAIRAVTLEPVVRVWVNPGNVMHEQYGSSRQIYAMQQPPTGLMLNTDEVRVVHDVLRRTANTVLLR